ncbi:hypothetical protein BD770DRAFT_406251 [Pilaira anomala]|nr:hypothetical protein BD770DRAFT_406251 [Pilaira anomala]
MSLPTNLTPEKDLMSKQIIQDPKVLNYITEAITRTENDYFIGNCEWKDGTRSDVVLQPKSSSMDLPFIIVKIHHTVNKQFMRRAVGYCLQANLKFDVVVLYHKKHTPILAINNWSYDMSHPSCLNKIVCLNT